MAASSSHHLNRWVTHGSFEDFAAGTLGAGGSNLYVTRTGKIEMIHRWDLNRDGFLDLLVPQDHNQLENADAFIYWGSSEGPRSLLPDLTEQQPLARLLRLIGERESNVTRLASDGGGQSLIVDLNGDDYPEIVFCNFIHNYSVYMKALIYWGSANGYHDRPRTELPTLMASGVTAADFNRDGYVDLAFANRGTEGGERHGYYLNRESYIYWNGPRGFNSERRTSIPSISAIDTAAGDLNGDDYPDLLLVNNDEQNKSVYLYWGSAEGFSETRRWEHQGGDPVGALLADLDMDGNLDLVLMHQDDRAQIWRGTDRGLGKAAGTELPTQKAMRGRSADLNRDGKIDLVFANQKSDTSYLYWGGESGFAPDRRLELPTQHATDVSLADFNRDGWIDVVFSNEYDDETFDVRSYLYWNGPTGFHSAHRTELQGFGPVSTSAGDLNRDGHTDLLLINRNSGSKNRIDTFIYWGNPYHHYSAASLSTLPDSSSAPSVADFNQDGWVDIVFPHGLLYWGSPDGYDPQRKLQLPVEGGTGTAVADLNRDGYLDLVVSTLKREGTNYSSSAKILWGADNGIESEGATQLTLATQITQSPTVADFNKDGYLDLVFPDVDSDQVDFFWGGEDGDYHQHRSSHLKVQPCSVVEVADLNDDDWLDLIVGGGWNVREFGQPTRMVTILWGGRDGFQLERSLQLEAYDSLEHAVADLNRDGSLDIVMSNYHAYLTRTIPAFIYWGGADRTFSEKRRSHLPAESSGALTVADLNQDSWMDIVVFNHLQRGDHGAGTNIFWGGPAGYSFSRRHWLQTFGPHFGTRRDVGNIYHRRLEEEYISVPLQIPTGKIPSRLGWRAQTPHGTGLQFQLRSATYESRLAASDWTGPEGAATSYKQPESPITIPPEHRWMQYRVLFTTPDGGNTAVLEEVSIDAVAQ